MRYRFMRFPGGKFKSVTLSYDDGVHADIRFAEVVSKHGMKCTFNVCSGLMSDKDGEHYMSANDIRNGLIPLGHEIAVHGHAHSAPGLSRPIDMIKEFLSCRQNLEKAFGTIIRGMAYPDSGIRKFINGSSYKNIREALSSIDIVYSRTLGSDNDEFELPSDWYAWMPTAHHKNEKIFEYIDKFISLDEKKLYCSARWPKLFYMWGHSSEFDRDDNWDRLDAICERLGDREDIWYATNMEIYNYVTAYDSLIFSADGSRIHNPTLYEVWFDIDGKSYSVKSGETLVI